MSCQRRYFDGKMEGLCEMFEDKWGRKGSLGIWVKGE